MGKGDGKKREALNGGFSLTAEYRGYAPNKAETRRGIRRRGRLPAPSPKRQKVHIFRVAILILIYVKPVGTETIMAVKGPLMIQLAKSTNQKKFHKSPELWCRNRSG